MPSPEIIEGLAVFAVAFLVTFATVPLSKRIAVYIGAIDYPSNRRINTEPVPRCGGIALYLGFMAACLTIALGVQFAGWTIIDLYIIKGVSYPVVLMGITVMFLVGLIDDILQIPPWVKLGGQIVAAIIVAYGGVSIDMVRSLVDGTYLQLDNLNIPLTVAYLVIFVNIINLIDGLDGLASGIVGIVALSMFFLVSMRGSFTLALLCLSIVAICLAFLRYNFYPASVFMGDSGALFLGLLLGIVSIAGIVRTQSLTVMLIPLVIAGVPVLDTMSAVIRRRRVHQRIEQADLGHIHHRLVKAGFGQRKAVLILYGCTALLAVVGFLLGSVSGPLRWLIFAVLFFTALLVVWRYGLFNPVLKHYYDNRGATGPRKPRTANHAAHGAAASSDASASEDAGAADEPAGKERE